MKVLRWRLVGLAGLTLILCATTAHAEPNDLNRADPAGPSATSCGDGGCVTTSRHMTAYEPPSTLTLLLGGERIAELRADGTVTLHRSAGEAARVFWEAVRGKYPEACGPRAHMEWSR